MIVAASRLGIHHQQKRKFLSHNFFADGVAIEGVNGASHGGAIQTGRGGPIVGDLDAWKNSDVHGRVGAMVLLECPHFTHCGQTPGLTCTGRKFTRIGQSFLPWQHDGFTHALRIGKALPSAAAVPAQALCFIKGAAIGIKLHCHRVTGVQKAAALGQARITFAPSQQQQGQCGSGQDFEHGCQQSNF